MKAKKKPGKPGARKPMPKPSRPMKPTRKIALDKLMEIMRKEGFCE